MPLRDIALRKRAAEMLIMLPDDPQDAARVMHHLRWLVDKFLAAHRAGPGSSPRSLAIVSDRSPILPSSIHPIDKPSI